MCVSCGVDTIPHRTHLSIPPPSCHVDWLRQRLNAWPEGVETIETDEELLSRQDALQADAASVLADLGLFALLAGVGRPVQTGSSALGLMVARDIDVTTLCPRLDARVFEVGRPLAAHQRVKRLSFRNDTGRWNTDTAYPDGLYWQVEYVTEAGVGWNLDLWFLLEGTTQFDLEHLRTLPPRLTRDARVAILRIKEALQERRAAERIRSYEIYEAVLDRGVRSPKEFLEHRRPRPDG